MGRHFVQLSLVAWLEDPRKVRDGMVILRVRTYQGYFGYVLGLTSLPAEVSFAPCLNGQIAFIHS